MTIQTTRRRLVLAAAALPFIPAFARATPPGKIQNAFQALEKDLDGRLGIYAIDTGTGREFKYRAEEAFAMCSTFKLMLSAAVLQRSLKDPALLGKRIMYSKADMVFHAPITEKHIDDGMTVQELCAATMQYSDNPAANLLMKELGGPAAVTAYARSIGDTAFRLDRWETELNSAIPGDERDTTTPQAMAQSLRKLALGDALPAAQQKLIVEWLIGNTTGATRIRAGLPKEWKVGDKTGAGAYGSNNDVAVVWPAGRAPVIMSIFTVRNQKDIDSRPDVLASAAKLIAEAL
ncbi:class A beta-lactamase [Massilia endophytica]|uniref:class A beta-lactamase n=1 Tax=Massilia endophytica TaxID=2899220 RepID=UPI001E2EFD07|nr:class A beta-lactamase [Massilia endophytica]UGQ48238.1 class A beta-lactamase [Massilia endophytica]